ncbi:hypothetical protein GKZ89_14165 [Bacillus mangrovi]|uniref:Thioredoxin domain-containing protein n=1 Tax=Metabacillus mangrovi TaxID=1491830 RepID=A0A7X2S6T2_9BACI|nr:thioredoxin family protein [Metabacillus mangrovi]MTH54545.1 hypothetical protein [Metabacillus mangrovi]
MEWYLFHYSRGSPASAVSLTGIIAADESTGEKIYSFDVSQNPEGWERFGIESIPTLVIFEKGLEYAKILGEKNRQQYELIFS